MARQLHFNLFLHDTGHHEASWRLPESDPHANLSLAAHQHLARVAEAAKFDSVFLADSPVLWGDPGRRPSGKLEPTLLLASLAASTSRIGLIATASTSYNEPYNLARRFASLDHLSGGRAGWNIVTTAGDPAARNFGLEHQPLHTKRYERADEFLDVSTKLWDSWDDDAIVADKDAGVHARRDRVRGINHRGRFFRVDGPLNVPRSPQAYPLLVQAGSSEDGKEFAAKWAEAVFTAQPTLAESQAFYADLKRRVVAAGRDPEHVVILPGIVPVIGDTQAQARELEAELDRLIGPRYAVAQLAQTLRVDPERLKLDERLPADLPDEDEIEGAKSRYTLIVDWARRENLTVRELIGKLGGGRGHRTFTGTPVQVADTIQQYFQGGAADGFNIMPAVLPSGIEAFADKVVPILQERGLFRTEYQAPRCASTTDCPGRPTGPLSRRSTGRQREPDVPVVHPQHRRAGTPASPGHLHRRDRHRRAYHHVPATRRDPARLLATGALRERGRDAGPAQRRPAARQHRERAGQSRRLRRRRGRPGPALRADQGVHATGRAAVDRGARHVRGGALPGDRLDGDACLYTAPGRYGGGGAGTTWLVGSPDDVTAALRRYAELGVRHFVLSDIPYKRETARVGDALIGRVRESEVHSGQRDAVAHVTSAGSFA